MKYIKLFFRVLLILFIPFLIQVVSILVYSIAVGIQYALQLGADKITEGIDTEVMQTVLSKGLMDSMDIIIMVSGIITVFVFFLTHVIRKKDMIKDYRFNKVSPKHLLFVVGLAFWGFMFSISFSSLTDLAQFDTETSEVLTNLVMNGSLFMTILSVGLIVPFVEEVIFRGSIFKNLSLKLSIKWAIILQALLFSLYHWNIVQAVPTFLLGLLAGIAVYYTNSIWSGVLIHVINNSLAVILSKTLPANFEFPMATWYLLLILAPIAIVHVLKQLRKNSVPWTSIAEEISVEDEFLIEA